MKYCCLVTVGLATCLDKPPL